MRNQSISPVAVFAFVSIYYILKLGVESAVGGVSMAVVEGVSSGVGGGSTTRKAMLISPVFVYLAFAILHIAFGFLKQPIKRIQKAVEQTFLLHLAFFVVSIGAFFTWRNLDQTGSQTIRAFQETTFGELIFAAGTWLPLILIAFFAWRYSNNGLLAETAQTSGALQETQAR